MNNRSEAWLWPMPVYAPEGDAGAADAGNADATVGDVGAADGDKSADANADAGDKSQDQAGEGDTADAGDDTGKKDGADDNGDETKTKLPENWRDLAADGDDDTLKLLKRYGSIKGVAKALREANDKIRTGKAGPTDEPMPDAEKEPDKAKAWRKERGIPDDPTGYVLPETVTRRMTDADKPMISSFTEFAHGKGASPAAVAMATEWYVEMAEQAQAQQTSADKENGSDTEENLRADWGAEYKGNINLAHRWVEAIPGLGTDFAVVRLPDGRRLVDVPEFVAWASDQGRAQFGDAVFASSDSEAKHNNRKAEIEKIMKTDLSRYHSEGLDKEYLEIIQREEKRRA